MLCPTEQLDFDAIHRRLNRLERGINQLADVGDSLQVGAVHDAASSLERACNRLLGKAIQLDRLMRRSAEREANPDAPHLKRRLPKVMKSLSTPQESQRMISGAMAALKAGRIDQWAEQYRRQMAEAG